MSRALSLAACLGLLAALGPGQGLNLTGDVVADFPAAAIIADPGSVDVGMPATLAGTFSGWDIQSLALAYDPVQDDLVVGIDAYGIVGDADGDGDPNASLDGTGNDLPAFEGGETFSVSFDLDDDGVLDVVCGVPYGSDLAALQTAQYNGLPLLPALAFGAPLAAHQPVLAFVPDASHPDLEFRIPAFGALLSQFADRDLAGIRVLVHLGSFSDGSIGEDYLPGPSPLFLPVSWFGCLPVLNQLRTVSIQTGATANTWTYRYGMRSGYGSCLVLSLADNPQGGWSFPVLPGNPELLVGNNGDWSSLVIGDLGVPQPGPGFVTCQDYSWPIPVGLPSGSRFYAQVLSYDGVDVLGSTWYASNRVIYTQP